MNVTERVCVHAGVEQCSGGGGVDERAGAGGRGVKLDRAKQSAVGDGGGVGPGDCQDASSDVDRGGLGGAGVIDRVGRA